MEFKQAVPVYLQIKEDIIGKIGKDEWKEDEKIPPEMNLADVYGVGRGTIREAIKQVVDEGYLYIKKGVGTFVAQKDVGISLEPFTSLTYFIKMRGLSITTDVLDKVEYTVDEELSKISGLELGSKCMYVKRLRLLKGKPLGIEQFYFSEYALAFLKDYDFTQPLSHYLFNEKKLKVEKMSIEFEITEPAEEIRKLLMIQQKRKIISTSRMVKVKPQGKIFYYMNFYCDENLSGIGTNNFV